MVDSALRVSPLASPVTVNNEIPPSVRAATTITFAEWPSSTNILWPSRL
jgi:hypothetical protein